MCAVVCDVSRATPLQAKGEKSLRTAAVMRNRSHPPLSMSWKRHFHCPLGFCFKIRLRPLWGPHLPLMAATAQRGFDFDIPTLMHR